MPSSYFDGPYYAGQFIDAYLDIITDGVDPNDDEDYNNFNERVAKFSLKASESIASLVESNKTQIAAEELKNLKYKILNVNQELIIDILTARQDQAEELLDESEIGVLQHKEFILDETKNIFRDLLNSISHELMRRNLDYSVLGVFINPNYKVSNSSRSPEKLTLKQQLILLEELKFFELPSFKSLTSEKRGALVSYLLGASKKNVTEYIRNLNTPKNMVSKDTLFVKTTENLEKVKAIMSELGLNNL